MGVCRYQGRLYRTDSPAESGWTGRQTRRRMSMGENAAFLAIKFAAGDVRSGRDARGPSSTQTRVAARSQFGSWMTAPGHETD